MKIKTSTFFILPLAIAYFTLPHFALAQYYQASYSPVSGYTPSSSGSSYSSGYDYYGYGQSAAVGSFAIREPLPAQAPRPTPPPTPIPIVVQVAMQPTTTTPSTLPQAGLGTILDTLNWQILVGIFGIIFVAILFRKDLAHLS